MNTRPQKLSVHRFAHPRRGAASKARGHRFHRLSRDGSSLKLCKSRHCEASLPKQSRSHTAKACRVETKKFNHEGTKARRISRRNSCLSPIRHKGSEDPPGITFKWLMLFVLPSCLRAFVVKSLAQAVSDQSRGGPKQGSIQVHATANSIPQPNLCNLCNLYPLAFFARHPPLGPGSKAI